MVNMRGTPWVMRLPPGLREQPAWIFIGLLLTLAGLSYMFGFAESTSITRVLDHQWLRVWGGFLALSGVLVIVSTWLGNRPLERLALRFMSLGILVYMGWILAVVPANRAMFAVVSCLSMVVLAEIRVGVLKALMRPLPASVLAWGDVLTGDDDAGGSAL